MSRAIHFGIRCPMTRPLHIGIVGCGVAGLAAAVALGRMSHRVTLIERAPALGLVGAGLLLQPSGQLALRHLGLLDAAIARAEPIDALHAWTHRGRTLVRLPYSKLGPGHTGYGVHRGDLFQVLHDAATRAGALFQLGTTILASRQTEREIFAVDDAGREHGPFDAARVVAAGQAPRSTTARRARIGGDRARVSAGSRLVQRALRWGPRPAASGDAREHSNWLACFRSAKGGAACSARCRLGERKQSGGGESQR